MVRANLSRNVRSIDYWLLKKHVQTSLVLCERMTSNPGGREGRGGGGREGGREEGRSINSTEPFLSSGVRVQLP